MSKLSRLVLACSLAVCTSQAFAKEYPVGQPILKNGMEIAGVYLQPVSMDNGSGHTHHMPAVDADIHLEADIHATENNPNGFAEGDWMPYLSITYQLQKLDGKSAIQEGSFMPMVASDGTHYGENVKMQGPGKYRVTYTIAPPSQNPQVDFGRHIDKETGVAEWWETFTVSWDFVYAGIGKKGGY
ncbi:MAG: iron transporter [Pseudomonas sp.]|jgi:uncharacterized protein involved in high-affinity Fe2+ transport|nr:iron transporter [Pseudomonas sp.]